jgi:flagellar biogenesis protein FliO
MSSLYFLVLPLFMSVLYKKVNAVVVSSKAGDHSKLKADIFFLGLSLIVIIGLVVAIEWIK